MTKAVKLDAIDLQIMRVLETHGRITNSALAEAVGLSPSPCLTRVDRLEKSGIITGYAANVDLNAICELVTVFVEVTLHDRRIGTMSRFEQKLRSIDEIAECAKVVGDCDYLLKIVARSVTHYRETIMKIVEESGLVDRYFSYFVVREFELQQRSFLNLVEDADG